MRTELVYFENRFIILSRSSKAIPKDTIANMKINSG